MATIYWVGGTGTWNTSSTTNWANSSGGTGGTGTVPTSADDVIFDSLSGSGTITLTGALNCRNITTTGSSFTFSSTGTLTVYGNITLSATTTWSATGLLTIALSSTITAPSTTFACSITISGSVVFTLASNLTLSSTSTFTFAAATQTLNLAGYTLSTGIFVSNGSTLRTVQFGTGNITCTGKGTVLNLNGNAFNYTGTPTINISNASATATTITATSFAENTSVNINITTGSYALTVTTASFFKSLNFTGFAGSWSPSTATATFYDSLTLVSGMSFTAGTGIFTFANTSGTATITSAGKTLNPITQSGAGGTVALGDALTLATTGTFTYTNGTLNLNNNTLSAGLFTSSNTNTRVIQFGTGNITIIGSGVAFSITGSNLTYTGTPTVNISNNSGTTTTVTAAVFTANNALDFNITTGTYALTIPTTSVFKSLNFTGFAGSWAPGTAAYTFYGSVTLVSGMTFTTGSGSFTFANTSGTATITSAGKTIPYITQNGAGGTVALSGALTISSSAGAYQLTNGTLNLDNNTLTACLFNSANSNTRAIQFGTGSINIAGALGSAHGVTITGTNLTYTGTPTVNMAVSSLGTPTIAPTSFIETNALNFNVTSGTGSVSIATGSVFNSLNFTGFTGTWSPSTNTSTFYGSLTLVSGMTFTTGTGLWTWANTSGTAVITCGSKTVGPITLNAPGATLQLGDTFSQTSTAAFTYTAGTLDLNSKANTFGAITITAYPTFYINGTFNASSVTQSSGTVTIPVSQTLNCLGAYTFTSGTLDVGTNTVTFSVGSLVSTSGTRVITFGNGAITTTGSGTAFNVVGNLLTYTGTPTINISNNSATAATVTATTGFTATNVFDFNFTTGTYALTLTTAAVVRSLNFTGFTGTWAPGTATATFYGNVTLVAGMTFTTGTGLWTLAATSGTQTITSGGKTLYSITQNGTGGTVALGDNMAMSSAATYNLTNGTLNLGSFTLTGSTTGITMVTGSATLNSSASQSTPITHTSGTLTLGSAFTTTGAYTFTAGTLNLNNFTLTCLTISLGANTVAFGTSGQITLTGNSTTVYSATTPTFTGTTKIVSNYSGGTGTRTFSMGTMSESNSINVSAGAVTGLSVGTAGTDAIVISGRLKSLDLTGFNGFLANNTRTLYGNLTIPNPAPVSGGGFATTLAATASTQTITSNGVTLPFPLTQNGLGGTVAINGDLTLDSGWTYVLTAGKLDLTNGSAGNYNLSCGSLVASSTSTRVISFGTGNITVTGNSNNGLTYSLNVNGTNLIYTGIPTVNISNNSSFGTELELSSFSETNAFNINVTTGTYNLTTMQLNFGLTSVVKSLNFTGFAGTWTDCASDCYFYGDLTLVSGMTVNNQNSGFYYFAATTGTQKITSAGQTILEIEQLGVGGTVQLQDNLTLSYNYQISNGTLDLNNFSLNCPYFYIDNSLPNPSKTIAFGTGNITVSEGWAAPDLTYCSFTGTPTVNINVPTPSPSNYGYVNNGLTAGGTQARSINLNVISGSTSSQVALAGYFNNVNFTGFSGDWSSYNNPPESVTFYGNLTLSGTMTTGQKPVVGYGLGPLYFYATSGTQTITGNGASLNVSSRQITFGSGTGNPIFAVTDGIFPQILAIGSWNSVSFVNGTLQLPAGITSYFRYISMATSSTLRYLTSSVPGTQAGLYVTNNFTHDTNQNGVAYLSIKDSLAANNSVVYLATDLSNVNAGNNTGWIFPVSYTMKIMGGMTFGGGLTIN